MRDGELDDGLAQRVIGAVQAVTAQAPARRRRVRKGRARPPEAGEADGLNEEERAALEAAAEEDGGAGAGLPGPVEEYRLLAAMCGKTVRDLIADRIDLNRVNLCVERRGPQYYQGKRVRPQGILRAFSYGWPFDIEKVRQKIEDELGGEDYVFRINHDMRTLRTMQVTIDEPPRTDLLPAGGDPRGAPPDAETAGLLTEKTREEARAELIAAKRRRAEAEQGFRQAAPEEFPGEQPEPLPEPQGPPQGFMSPEEVEAMIADRLKDRDLKDALREMQRAHSDEMKALLAEVRNAKSGGKEEGMGLIVAAMQQSTASMMEGLKLVVSNVGQQLNASQSQQAHGFDNMLKLIAMANEGKKNETQLLMQLAGQRMEAGVQQGQQQLELIKTGMEFASNLQGGGGGEAAGDDSSWANKSANLLLGLIGKQLMTQPQAPAAAPAQAAPSAGPSEEQINAAAGQIAARAIAKVRAKAAAAKAGGRLGPAVRPGRPAPGAPKAPAGPGPDVVRLPPESGPGVPIPEAGDEPEADGGAEAPVAAAEPAPVAAQAQKVEYVGALLTALNQELDDLPVESRFAAILLQAPSDMAAALLGAEKLNEVLNVIAPYASPEQIGDVGAKLLPSTGDRQQKWLVRQLVMVKAAFARDAAQAEGGA